MKPTSFVPFASAAIFLALSTGKLVAGGPNPISTRGLDPNQAAIANNINSGHPFVVISIFPPFFAPTNTKASQLAYAINRLPASAQPGALDQLSPEEFGRFTSMTAFNNASFETEAMDNYLAGRRDQNGNFFGGSGSIDASGLVLGQPGYDPNLSALHSHLLALNQGPSAGTVSDVTNSLFGGTDMKDMKSMAGPAYTNPWNFFVRGSVILSQGLSEQDVSHFDGNTESVVIGTDYRLDPNFLLGLTLGYGHTDVTLDTANSSATVDSYSPGLYASYADKGWYADLTGNYVYNAYTQARNISFLGETANSATQGNEGVANIDGGYDFHQGAFTFGPLAGLQYTHLSVNAYSETGAALADLNVDDQETDSLRSRLGGRVSYTFNCGGLCFQPHLDATWQHEFMDQGRGITSQFESAGLGSFTVRTENPSRDFALADFGVDLKINRSITAFTDYEVQAGQADYFGQSVQAGITIGF